MRLFRYLLLTALAAGPAWMAGPAAAEVTEPAIALFDGEAPGAVLVSDSRHGSNHFGSLHGRGSHHFRHPGFSHDRHFSQDHRRFLGSDHRHFRGHDRHFSGRDNRHFRGHDRHFFGKDRHFRSHDRHFFGRHDRHDHLFRNRHPHFDGYVPGSVSVCYRSGSVLVCYGS